MASVQTKRSATKKRARASPRPIAIDLFSGAGGLSLGFEQAGFDIVAALEYDAIHSAVHKYNFPRCEVLCADAATVKAEKLRQRAEAGVAAHQGKWTGEIDVVIGGPPCQGFSTGGKRAFDDPRNQLVREFARLVGGLKPRYFVMENVPGMTSVVAGGPVNATMMLDLVVEELESFGYQVHEPRVLNASEYGVPQDRQRLILIGARKGEEFPSYPDGHTRGRSRGGAESPSSDKPQRSLPLCPSVWDAIGDLPDLDEFDALLTSDETRLTVDQLEALEERSSAYVRLLRSECEDPSDFSWPRNWDPASLTSSLRTTHDGDTTRRFEATAPGHSEGISRFFRLHRDGVSSTLRAGTGYERGSFNAPRPIHPAVPRVISVREAARLHSFPDWFRLNWTKWHGFRQVGNSLPPLVGRAVGAEIVRSLRVTPVKPEQIIDRGDRELLYLDTTAAAKRMGADLSRAPRHALRTRARPEKRAPSARCADD
jgi:DNA (cytosine-5)-methyltransferase 1